ncbi:universal stress protein [bacterium]|nr:universal stress protein [bacterium]
MGRHTQFSEVPGDLGPDPARLQKTKGALERQGAQVSTRILRGEPAAAILELADEGRPDLIALSTHGRTGVKRWIRGSVAERVLQGSRYPLLMANPFAVGGSGELSFRRILVPLDGSLESAKILPLVHDVARAYEAEVILAHAIEIPPGPAGEVPTSEPGQVDGMLSHFAKQLGGVTVRRAVLRGSPAAEILELAEREKADLVALTTHGRSGTSRWIYGSVAELVLHHVRTPILVLRTAGFEETSGEKA